MTGEGMKTVDCDLGLFGYEKVKASRPGTKVKKLVKLVESPLLQKKRRTYDESLEILLEHTSNCLGLADTFTAQLTEDLTFWKTFNKDSKSQETLEKEISDMIELEGKLRSLMYP